MTPAETILLASAVAAVVGGIFILAIPRLALWYFEREGAA